MGQWDCGENGQNVKPPSPASVEQTGPRLGQDMKRPPPMGETKMALAPSAQGVCGGGAKNWALRWALGAEVGTGR